MTGRDTKRVWAKGLLPAKTVVFGDLELFVFDTYVETTFVPAEL